MDEISQLEAELENMTVERDELRRLCQETQMVLGQIDDWLGMASTRQAAMDSMWRLSRSLGAVGLQYDWRHALDWRGALVKELNEAGFFNSPEGMRYDPTAERVKPFRNHGNAVGPTLKEMVALTHKRAMLEWVLNALAGVIDSWNDVQADGDRGRGNDALGIVLSDDGSGQVGTVYGELSNFNPQEGTFGSVADWVAFFDLWISDAEWQQARPELTAAPDSA